MNLSSCKYCFIALAGIVLSFSGIGQKGWKLQKDKDGIKVYTRDSDKSAFDEFRATMQLNQSIHSFVAVIRDVESLHEWAYNVKNARPLKMMGDSLQYYYSEVSIPFPFTDRDGIYRNSYTWKSDSSLLIIDIDILPVYIEKKEDLVRIPFGKGFWRVKVLGDRLIDITFQMVVDPGGGVPSWMANIFIDDTPTYTLTKLREVIVKEKYQNRKFDFLE
jgi:hypothetical protein